MGLASAKRGIWIGLAANGFLLALKALASGLSDSLAIFSETLNSLSDFVGAIVVLIFVQWAHRTTDKNHPFGHERAEPIAGLTLAIFTAILGFEVVRSAVLGLALGTTPSHIGWFPVLALVIAGVVKGSLAGYFRKLGQSLNSPAFRASAVDCRNDVLVASQAILGLLLAQANLGIFDRVAALAVGVYILYSGYRVGIENIDFLMGKAPDEGLCERIRRAADGVPFVHEVGDLRAHYVGTQVHVELTIRVGGEMSTADSHDVAEEVRACVESIPGVARAFVHVEPVVGQLQPSS